MVLRSFWSLAFACAAIGIYGAGMPAQAEDNGGITSVENAVQVGLSASPRLGEVVNNTFATDEEKRQAESLYYPRVDLRADTGREFTDNASVESKGLWRYNTGLTLSQMLFDGFAADSENARQANRLESARNRVTETGEFVALDIIEAYLDVLRQREILAIARENLDKHNNILKQMKEGTEAGRSTEADLQQAQARLASARSIEASTRESLRIAESKYIRHVGSAPGTLQRPPLLQGVLAATVDDEVNSALTQSPTLAARDADIRTADSEKEAAKSPFYPRFDVQVSGQRGENQGGLEDPVTSASALVTMNWNLYRGGADTARVKELTYRQQQTKETAAQAAREIEDDVRQTWARMVSAGERAEEFRKQAEANKLVVGAYLDQFNLDRRTLLDVLDSQNEFFVSRSNMINAEYLKLFAVYRLLALRGQLLPTLQVSYPQGTEGASKG